MALPTFEKKRLIGLIAILSFGVTSLSAVLSFGVLGPAAFILGFFVLIPLVVLLGDDFPLVGTEEPTEESVSAAKDDPLATLRERYATGEIGEEEFERKLDRLLETEELTGGVEDGPTRDQERELEFD